uniref:Scm like with four mbt domains 2 n=1 Tax=Naja naja TaxID=35670 RepID=A0A8C6X8J9_NAJNA
MSFHPLLLVLPSGALENSLTPSSLGQPLRYWNTAIMSPYTNPEEAGFNWDEYLEETESTAAPHSLFKHVEISLQSSLQPGMKLEVANKHNADTYWVATTITTCGQLLLLRYCGYEDDRRADFWCDVMTADLHPVGWCTQNGKVLMPPDGESEAAFRVSRVLLLFKQPLRGKNAVDLITLDSLIELQDGQSPFQFWIVSVVENVGGRLRLRYAGLEETDSYDQWLFYLDCRLRPVGWCQENKYQLEPPAEISSLKTASEWQTALNTALAEAEKRSLPMEVFKDHADLRNHSFTVGMKLEAVDQREPVFNHHFVQVTLDDLRPEPCSTSMLCHADSLGLLPVQWCLKNGVHLTPPKGYSNPDFDWADYQKQCGAEAAPEGYFRNAACSRAFMKNMMLEAVNPQNPAEICVASVNSVKGRLIWLSFEGLPHAPPSEYIVDVQSMDIFPVGWCEANGYKLWAPHKNTAHRKRKIAIVQPEKENEPQMGCWKKMDWVSGFFPAGTINGRYNCPVLFINHRCFSGPHLNKGRLADLPRSVGPGKCVLVLKEILRMVINSAYKPGSILRELQRVSDPRWNFQEENLKAKYRGKTYRAMVKIVRTSDQVSNFCRKVCAKLECCPNLFGPIPVAENCPENCSSHTKTKYGKHWSSPTGGMQIQSFNSIPWQESDEEEADTPWSEETIPELQDDLTDVSLEDLPLAIPMTTMKLRSRRGSIHVARPERDGQAQKALSFLRVKSERTRQAAEEKLILESNPLEWTVPDVVQFLRLTDCAPLAKIFQEQDIDGQALLLLTLPTVQECMELKLGPAIKLCHQIERVKLAFYAQYAN